jgi:hypothetical protein
LYPPDLTDFHTDMARFREEVCGELATLRTEMYQLHAQIIIWLASLVATGVALTVTLVKVIP